MSCNGANVSPALSAAATECRCHAPLIGCKILDGLTNEPAQPMDCAGANPQSRTQLAVQCTAHTSWSFHVVDALLGSTHNLNTTICFCGTCVLGTSWPQMMTLRCTQLSSLIIWDPHICIQFCFCVTLAQGGHKRLHFWSHFATQWLALHSVATYRTALQALLW